MPSAECFEQQPAADKQGRRSSGLEVNVVSVALGCCSFRFVHVQIATDGRDRRQPPNEQMGRGDEEVVGGGGEGDREALVAGLQRWCLDVSEWDSLSTEQVWHDVAAPVGCPGACTRGHRQRWQRHAPALPAKILGVCSLRHLGRQSSCTSQRF